METDETDRVEKVSSAKTGTAEKKQQIPGQRDKEREREIEIER